MPTYNPYSPHMTVPIWSSYT
jgi:hypothetical protein